MLLPFSFPNIIISKLLLQYDILLPFLESPWSHIIINDIYYNNDVQDRFFMVLHGGKMRKNRFKLKDVPSEKPSL